MTPAAGVPIRPLAVLTAAVLVLHGLALEMACGTLWTGPRPAPLVVRAIEPARLPVAIAASARSTGTRPDRLSPAPVALGTTAGGATRQRRQPPAVPAAGPEPAAVRAAPAETVVASSAPTAIPAGAAPATLVVATPAPARWHYRVTARHRGMAVTGEAELAWRHDGHTYEAVLQVTAPPLPARLQRSTGLLAADGLAPLRFSEHLRSEQASHFERERGRIVFSSNRPEAVLQPGAQDRLSVLLQLAAAVAGDPARFVPGAVVPLQVATTREAISWAFEVQGPQPLLLPAGRVQTIKLARPPQHEYDLRIEVWLVPGRDYGPARLRLTAPHGDWLDLHWSGTDKG